MWSGAIPQHPVETTRRSFSSLGLAVPTLEVLLRIGFFHPTPIQAAVIPAALDGRDILGLAETGSGKTAAFALPIAERLFHGRGLRGLVLAPTRELALQTKAFLDLFGQFHGLRTVALIGGVALGPQTDELRRKPDIAVATPGRLTDHLERRNLALDAIEVLVLDEGDHMLDMGFLPQVQRLLRYVPPRRQTMLFSATMPAPIERLARELLRDPMRVDVLPSGGAARGISHRLYLVEAADKKACLQALLSQELGSTLVFIRRRSDAEWLSRVLERKGHPVERLHGDLSQAERLRALRGFREGQHRILVATDVASRGLDIPTIRHIVNFELPETVDDYIHRAGRTARGAALGLVSSIATWQDRELIGEIEQRLGEKLPRCSVAGVRPYEEPKPRRPTVRRRRLL